jgi:hypothetical protein
MESCSQFLSKEAEGQRGRGAVVECALSSLTLLLPRITDFCCFSLPLLPFPH